MSEHEAERPTSDPKVLATLVESHRTFLRFLEKRVESAAVAEEILQSAFVKTLEKGSHLRDEESAVAWFYRLLQNAVVDHYRRRGVERRGLEKETQEAAAPLDSTNEEVRGAICACMRQLLPSLKPEYAEMLNKVDLEDREIAEVAAAAGITVNNATVRLHRARQALKGQLQKSCGTCATHGCLDCSCGSSSPGINPRS